MNGAISAVPSRARLRAFALGSVVLHGIVLAGWQTSPWIAGQTNSVISVTLISNPVSAAPVEARLSTQTARKIPPRPAGDSLEKPAETSGANHDRAQALALRTTPAKAAVASVDFGAKDSRSMGTRPVAAENPRQDNAQDTPDPTSPSAPATGENDERGRAKAQIQARLHTDLARYFDYPYAARLRGWEGTVLLAFNIEASGRLENIRVARSSGYAVLDDSALSALRKVRRLAETSALFPGRAQAMQIPVIYRLRCPDTQACRGNSLAAAGPEDR